MSLHESQTHRIWGTLFGVAVLVVLISSVMIFKIPENPSRESSLSKDAQEVFIYKVIDGDTVAVSIDGKDEAVRLIGIDAPESVHPTQKVECFGKEAAKYLREIAENKYAILQYDETQQRRDKYNRLLGYLFIDDQNINEKMLRDGYAYEYTYQIPYRYQAAFQEAERQAQEKKRGLWADGACARFSADALVPNTTGVTDIGEYICSYNAYDCKDFNSQQQAQQVYILCGGTGNDIHWLDRDTDGNACELLE